MLNRLDSVTAEVYASRHHRLMQSAVFGFGKAKKGPVVHSSKQRDVFHGGDLMRLVKQKVWATGHNNEH